MKTTFRFPGSVEYAFAEIETSEGSVYDNERELRDISDNFLSLVGDVLRRGCGMVALAPVATTVVQDSAPPSWGDGASAPEWASAPPQEAQGYPAPPQGGYAPQSAYQSPPQGYQTPQAPPGQQAPMCQMHQRPAEYKPAGVSKRTNKPYSAFWVCATGDNNCTRASNFPKA